MGKDISSYLVKHVNEALDFIDKIRANRDRYLQSLEWLLHNCRGDAVVTDQNIETVSHKGGCAISLYMEASDNHIVWPTVIPEFYAEYARDIMKRCDDLN